MSNFNAWSLPAPMLKALVAMKFETPTPIQAQAIPIALMGKDIIGCAQTGTGKTAAFCIPLLARMVDKPNTTALILTPTRELAAQISEVLRKLTNFMPEMRTTLLIGGAAMGPQMRSLHKKPRIVIATPGRLMDHLRRRSLTLKLVDVLVLDEADRMLDMGFAPQLEEIQDHLPEDRQTMLFSATIPGNIKRLAANYLRNPEQISVGPVAMPAPKIIHSVLQTTHGAKNNLLMDELNKREGSVLIFAKTKHGTDRLADYLLDTGYSVTRIHGDRSQAQRDSAVNGFRQGSYRILVATDVVARGLDVPHIAHVINYDLPMCPEDYVHRIGRTARAGAEGHAVCLLTPADRGLWRRIARMYNYEVGDLKAFPREANSSSRDGRGGGARRSFSNEPSRRPRSGGPVRRYEQDRPVRFNRREEGGAAPQNRQVLGLGGEGQSSQRPLRGRFTPRGGGATSQRPERPGGRFASGGKSRSSFRSAGPRRQSAQD
jgi:superfamily II DNA/RNA helicase